MIIVPDPSQVQTDLEGFGEQAKAYMEWLKQNAENLRLLQYGYTLKQEAFSEQVVTDSVKNVVDRVSQEVKSANNPFDAVVLGVDEPWDVCLIRLFWLMTVKSAPENIREFEKERELELRDGIPMEIRYPYVPGMNDSEAENIACFVKELKSVKYVRLLAYHNYAERKYERSGRSYPLSDVSVPQKTDIERVAKKMRTCGLDNVVLF